jgi:hypothetical protein
MLLSTGVVGAAHHKSVLPPYQATNLRFELPKKTILYRKCPETHLVALRFTNKGAVGHMDTNHEDEKHGANTKRPRQNVAPFSAVQTALYTNEKESFMFATERNKGIVY